MAQGDLASNNEQLINQLKESEYKRFRTMDEAYLYIWKPIAYKWVEHGDGMGKVGWGRWAGVVRVVDGPREAPPLQPCTWHRVNGIPSRSRDHRLLTSHPRQLREANQKLAEGANPQTVPQDTVSAATFMSICCPCPEAQSEGR